MAHRARKRFGQHFLVDTAVIDAISRAIHADENDVVVEIGPGQGALTQALSGKAGHLHAIELDRDLVTRLERQYGDNPRVTIHAADALKFDFAALGPRLRIVGNLPYNISTPLLFHLLHFREHIVDLHFMLQKEVVDRMAAGPGTKTYGRLSIMLGCEMAIEPLFDVEADAFDPPPKVRSAVVRLDPLPPGHYQIADHRLLSHIVSAAFMKRRKTLRNALKDVATDTDFSAVALTPTLRPEQVSITDFIALSNQISMRMR